MQCCFFSFAAHDPLKGMSEGSQGHWKRVLGGQRIVEVVDAVPALGQKSEFRCVKPLMADDPAAAVHIDHRRASRNLRIGFQDFEGFVGPSPIAMVDDRKALMTPDPPRLRQGSGCVDRSPQPMQRQALCWAERVGQKMGIDRIRHRPRVYRSLSGEQAEMGRRESPTLRGEFRVRRFDSVGNFQNPTESKRKSPIRGVSVDTWGSNRPLPD